MEELQILLQKMLTEELDQIVLSNSVDKEAGSRVKIRPVLLKGELRFQETLYKGTQVFHGNYEAEEMAARIVDQMSSLFRQAQINSSKQSATVLISKRER